MALNPTHSAPSLNPVFPIIAVPQGPERVEESPLPELREEKEPEKKRLSLQQAKTLFESIQARYPKYRWISPAVLLEVDIFNRLYALKRPEVCRLKALGLANGAPIHLEMSQLIDNAISDLLSLFRQWRRISLPANPPKECLCNYARGHLVLLWTHYTYISTIIGQSSLGGKYHTVLEDLKARLDIVDHLAASEEFLDRALKVASGEEEEVDATLKPETVQLIEEGMTMASYTMHRFKKYVEEEIKPAFSQIIRRLEKSAKQHPELDPLLRSMTTYFKDISEAVDFYTTKHDLPAFLSEIQQNPLSMELRLNISKLIYLDILHIPVGGKVAACFLALHEKWDKKALSVSVEPKLGERLDLWEKLIRKQCEALAKNSAFESLCEEVLRLVALRDQLMDKKNSHCADTFRIPSLLMQQSAPHANTLKAAYENALIIIREVKRAYPHYQFNEINYIDFIVHESMRLLEGLPRDSQPRLMAEKLIKHIVNRFLYLEFWDEPQRRDPRRLEELAPALVDHFLKFQKVMKSIAEKNGEFADFVNILDCISSLLPVSDHPPSFKKVQFASFYSFLYQNLGDATQQKKASKAKIQFMQEQLQQSLQMDETLANGTVLAEIKDILGYFKLHPEVTGQPKEFWKLSCDVMDFLKERIHSAHRLGNKIKGEVVNWSTIPLFVTGIKSFLNELEKILNTETADTKALLLDVLQNEARAIQDPRGAKLLTLLRHFGIQSSFAHFLYRPFYLLIESHDLRQHKKRPEPQVKEQAFQVRPKEEKESESTPDLEQPPQSYIPTPYERMLEPLHHLQGLAPVSLGQEEEPFSRFMRTEKMAHAVRNHLFLLELLEEEKATLALQTLFRGSTDQFRLLEMTEKLALTYLPIRGISQKQHLILDPNQRHLFSHDGVHLAHILSQEEPLFGEGEFLKDQERVLKVGYWFRGEIPPANPKIVSCCQDIWPKLVAKGSTEANPFVFSLREMQRYRHKEQRQLHQSIAIPRDLPPLATLIAALEGKALQPIVDLAKALNEHRKMRLSCPLLFTNRHAEVQVGLLSTLMQSCLATFDIKIQTDEGPKHPLDCNYDGTRPLRYSHNVEHLWKALSPLLKEGDESLAAKLKLFVGDPRYPYPNKNAITADLVTTFELSKLLRIAKGGFIDRESRQLFNRYNLSSNLSDIEKKLEEHLDQVERKTCFAFQLGATIFSKL